MSLSAVVITLDEEAVIERCLRALEFADEIVVVDSISADRTVEIARRFADRLVQREFAGYSDQKAAALGLAASEWVLAVDADEVITGELASEIRAAIDRPGIDGYWIPRSTWFVGKKIEHSGWSPDYHLRLARRSKASYPDRLVHEAIEVDGVCGRLENPILHYSHPDLDVYARKMVRYARAAALQKFREGRRFRVTDILFNPTLTFLKMYAVKQGFRDGLHGLILSALTASSTALRYAMLWELGLQERARKEQVDES